VSLPGVRPLTVVSGALGSGKTTLLRGLLSRPHLRSTAVLVNELGEIGLDHHQLRHVDERTVVLPGGCVCCATRSDVESALHELLATEDAGHVDPVRRVVLETTGLADPAPVVATLQASPTLRHHFAVDRVVVTVDAQALERDAGRGPEWLQQVVCADQLVLTKTDLVPAATVGDIATRLRRLNPAAPVMSPAEVDLAGPTALVAPAATTVAPLPEGRHLSGVASASVTLDGPVDWAAFAVWISALLHAHGDRILRMKALLDTGGEGPVVLDAVQHVVHPPRHLPHWDGARTSSLVLITRDLPPGQVVAALQRFLGQRRPAATPAGGDRLTYR
jgi:G3E family GTPase